MADYSMQTVTVPTRLDGEILEAFFYASRGLRAAYADVERLARSGRERLEAGGVPYEIGANALVKVSEAQARFEAKREALRLASGLTREDVQVALTADALLVRNAEEA